MNEPKWRVSRRSFLGGTAAAFIGGVGGPLASLAEAQKPTPPLALAELSLRGTPDEAYWWKVRSQFDLVDGLSFMNNGTLGPVPRVVFEENDRVAREIAADPTNGYRREELDERRKDLAAFVGAEPEEVSYTRSTTEGMNIFAKGVDWSPGDEILMCTHEHGGGIKPYESLSKRRGIEIKWLDVPSPPESVDQLVDVYEKAIGPKTRGIMVSHMTYVTGLVMPIRELSDLAHRRGLLISVDGAHPLGMIDLDFHELGCDHYAAAGQKWLLCGTGTGLNYIKRDVQEQVWPLMGAGTYNEDGERKTYDDARKYEDCGQRDVPSAMGMLAAVRLQNTVGKKNVEARVRSLSERLRRGLAAIDGVKLWTSTHPSLSAGLTLFSVRDVPMENVQAAILERERVYIRTMSTGNLNAVRASTHLYNMPHEVDRLLDGVRHVAKHDADYMTRPTA